MAETIPEGTSPDEQSIMIIIDTIRPPKWPTGSQKTLSHETSDLSFPLYFSAVRLSPSPSIQWLYQAISPADRQTNRQTEVQRGEEEEPQRRLHKSVCEPNVAAAPAAGKNLGQQVRRREREASCSGGTQIAAAEPKQEVSRHSSLS